MDADIRIETDEQGFWLVVKSENIERLVIELVTLPFSQQNEIWSALRVAYHPSVLYKVKMVVFQDEDGATPPDIGETTIRISP